MYIDTQETFSTAQAVASVVGDVVSTNIIDTGAVPDVGPGKSVYVYAKLVAALAGAGSAIQVVLQTATDEAFTTPIDIATGPVFLLAAATANKRIAQFKLPHGLKRYLRLAYRTSLATSTGGTVSAHLALDLDANASTPSGVSAT